MENFTNSVLASLIFPYLAMGLTVITPYLGSDVTVLHLLLVFLVIQCVTVRCGLWFAFVEFLLRT